MVAWMDKSKTALTTAAQVVKNQNRNSGAISLILRRLQDEVAKRLEEGFHGEVSVSISLVGHDISEFKVGSAARTVVK